MPRLGLKGCFLLLVLAVGAFSTIVAIQIRLQPVNSARRLGAIRYIPSRNALRLTSFGYRQVYADLLWVQAIQYLATPFESPDAKYEWLDSIFDAITDLDPRFVSAYRLGATWLTLLKRDGPAGIRLLEKGMAANPDRWELPHDIAMIHFVDRRDRTAALDALRIAVEKPDCPLHVRAFAQYLLVEKDEGWAAIAMWQKYLEQNQSDIVRNLAWENLCKIQCQMIRKGVDRFEEAEGRRPASLEELLASGLVELRDWFDLAGEIEYEPATGEIRSPRLERIQVEKGLYMLRMAIDVYQADQGRPPRSLDELRQVIRRPPRHPRHDEGYAYGYDPAGRRVFVVEPAGAPR